LASWLLRSYNDNNFVNVAIQYYVGYKLIKYSKLIDTFLDCMAMKLKLSLILILFVWNFRI